MTKNPDYVSLDDAAKTLGVTPLNILMHVKNGLLAGKEEADGWLIAVDSLSKAKALREAGSRPTLCSKSCHKPSGGCACGG